MLFIIYTHHELMWGLTVTHGHWMAGSFNKINHISCHGRFWWAPTELLLICLWQFIAIVNGLDEPYLKLIWSLSYSSSCQGHASTFSGYAPEPLPDQNGSDQTSHWLDWNSNPDDRIWHQHVLSCRKNHTILATICFFLDVEQVHLTS